jgi:hypothetical protein
MVDLNLILYIVGWVLILIIVIAITVVVYFSTRINQCRTNQILYCYANQTNGWRCTNTSGSTPTTTLADTISAVQNTTQLVPCPSTADKPGPPIVYASYVLAPSATGVCNTNLPDNQLPAGCKSTGPLAALVNFPGDPYVIPPDGLVTAQSIFNWYCNPALPPNADNSTKRADWMNFIALNPDFQVSQPVTFVGQQG